MFVKERFKLREESKKRIYSLKPDFGYGEFGEFIFYKTYSRVKDDGSMETWNDCVIRVTEGTFSIRKDHYIKNKITWDEEFWQHYALHFAESMFNMEWLPPGRGLWAMGSDFVYNKGSMALYNCAFTVIGDDVTNDCKWTMDTLMYGVGVGFTPERNDEIEIFEPRGLEEIIIDDSREGWCDSVESLIDCYTKPNLPKPVFKYHEIRPSGELIKGFGGIASGPKPLQYLHLQIEKFFQMYQSYDWYDSVLLKTDLVNSIGCCVVSGNVRRSAELACSSIDDSTFIDLKDYVKYPYRADHGWMSNNSVILDKDEDFLKLKEIARRVVINGEPGYVNKRNLEHGRLGKYKDKVRRDKAIGFNPCQPSWAKVLTPEGIREFKDIDIGSLIWSETGWTKVINKWSTGVNKVYEYRTTAGVFYGTENHQIVSEGIKCVVKYSPTIDTLKGQFRNKYAISLQDVMDGLVVGDGTEHNGIVLLNIGEKDQDYFSSLGNYIHSSYNKSTQFKITTTIKTVPFTYLREVPEEFIKGSYSKVAGFLRGLFSANGCVTGNRVQLKATSFKLIEQVQMMLSSLGIQSYYTTNKSKLNQFENGVYQCKESYDLNISTDRDKFALAIGFIQKYKNEALAQMIERVYSSKFGHKKEKETFDIVEINLISEEETFDITVDNCFHTYWTQCCNVSNCGEIPLENKEVCNVAETLPTRCRSLSRWIKACEYATMYMSTVSLLPTHSKETNAIVARNRRIGCSIIDVTGWILEEGLSKVIANLKLGYAKVCSTNYWANTEAGVPLAIRHTTVKPGKYSFAA